jgi:hypothetical protein
LIELEAIFIFHPKLVDTVKPLKENRRLLILITVQDSIAVSKFVAKLDPLPLDKGSKAFERTIVRISNQHAERDNLRCSVPPVRTVDEHRDTVFTNRLQTSFDRNKKLSHVLQPVC